MSMLPGGELSRRPLHFIWLADCSGSMLEGGKIQALNTAIHEAVPHMQEVAEQNPNASVLVRAVKFSSGAQWHVPDPTPVKDFTWTDLDAGGVTDMGKALALVADQLRMPPMDERALPPVLVLVSDGLPTDDFNAGLRAVMDEPWGKKSVRVAIAIGADADHDVLRKFIGHDELRPLQANNPEALAQQIRWVSTAVLKSASTPAAGASEQPQFVLDAPNPAPASDDLSEADVW